MDWIRIEMKTFDFQINGPREAVVNYGQLIATWAQKKIQKQKKRF